MAVEKLTTFLVQLVAEAPLGHPDRAYLESLRERHISYAESTSRLTQVHEYEGRRIFARSEAERKQIIASVLPVVSDIFDVPVNEIVGKSRIKEVMRPKFAASYLFHTVGNLGLSDIARIYGGRDHTTIINHISRARELMGNDELFTESVLDAENALRQIVSPQAQNGSNG